MVVTFSCNPIDRLSCDIDNWILSLKHKRWNKGYHSCECRMCGQVLNSRKDECCPEECGWARLKGERYNPWICHQCLDHHDEHWVRKDERLV